ncbi:hypothetical protein [Nocardioides antri]|uniref:Uncharacterized protein n=1 Tax=Nocardioides antri TaxID=2607659 RepID=A0A5B1M0M3_9ACTN|nr:hypothetical protein [Nocardioides antri]KAA1426291.1 hypothetical protein F0U47_15445 [Nocardioides antri]
MRSIRLRRRPGQGVVPPPVRLGDDADGHDDSAASDLTLPRDLLPADQRARADRPALARRLRAMAHPRFYAAQVGEPSLADDLDGAIAHFLDSGLRDGARISGLFNPPVYRERARRRGLELADDEDPFLHFLSVGWDERVVPTVLFDEAFYLGRHPDLANGPEWGFAQYVRAGCYAPGRSPTPFGPNYGGVPAPDARERQDPPLVTGLLHRAADYDLTCTSWLEEGVTAGIAKLAKLGSDRMRDLVARAAAIEPLIAATPRERWVSWPPHTHPMMLPTARAEDVRRGLGLVRADTVVVVPGGSAAGPGLSAAVAGLRDRGPGGTTLVVTTDGPARPDLGVEATGVDLSVPWTGFTEHRRLLGLLDLVRGVRPRRLVVSGSELGWRLLSSYGTTLQHEMSLAAVLGGGDPDAASFEDFQGCFDRLDWVVTESDALRDDLAARYLLPAAARARVLGPSDVAAGCLKALVDREEERDG